jgi:hypothetical protein
MTTNDAEPEGSRRQLIAGMTRSASACASGLTIAGKLPVNHTRKERTRAGKPAHFHRAKAFAFARWDWSRHTVV